MSLSQQLQRVDGSQNETLKAILRALGVSASSQKVDQLPALAAAISNKVNPENILSSATAASLGLPASATANDAFLKLSSAGGLYVTGTYIGNGTTSDNDEQEIVLGFRPSAVIVAYTGYFSPDAGYKVISSAFALYNHPSYYGTKKDRPICLVTEQGFKVYRRNNIENGIIGSLNYSFSGDNEYYYIAFR